MQIVTVLVVPTLTQVDHADSSVPAVITVTISFTSTSGTTPPTRCTRTQAGSKYHWYHQPLNEDTFMSRPLNPKTLRLQAQFILHSLPDLCRKDKRSVESALRIASHFVYDEDVLMTLLKPCQPSIERAKEYHRLLQHADDPEYPESARRFHLQNEAKLKKIFPWLCETAAGPEDRTDKHGGDTSIDG